MTLNSYMLVVTSNLYKQDYTIRAETLQDANKKAKIKFAQDFKSINPETIKVSLAIEDVENHIYEILDYVFNTSKKER